MQGIRPAAVAGMFYPGSRGALARDVQAYLAEAEARPEAKGPLPKVLIVPHAGYVYSGPVAASAYARLAAGRGVITRVVLFGPVHRVPVRGLALPVSRSFETPLGIVAVDQDAVAAARRLPQVRENEAAHAAEHSLEVQLPFLQAVLGEFALVPFAVGDASPAEVAEVADLLWGGPETLIVVSSDLSHYHRYADARRIDRETVDAILDLAADIDHEQACGATPVNGLMLSARRHGLRPSLLDLRNSGDTAGDRSQVVGYAAIAFVPGADDARP
jgi:AmmeMemoRadiSam system protein B